MKLQSDERLVALAREGHEQAFAAIVERYQRPLTSYCRRLLGPDLAQDAVQQTFATAYAQLIEGAGPVHLRAWLYRVAGNLSISMLRRRYTDHQELTASIGDLEESEPHAKVERSEQISTLLERLRKLPDRERHALLLKEMEGRPFEEIAQLMDATPKGAKQLAYRARRRLRDALGALLPVPLLLWLLRGGSGSGIQKGAFVAAKGAKHGALVKFAAAVLVSAGAAYGISAAGHDRSPADAIARDGGAKQSSLPQTTSGPAEGSEGAVLRRTPVSSESSTLSEGGPAGGNRPAGEQPQPNPSGNRTGGAELGEQTDDQGPGPSEPPTGPGGPTADTTPPETTILSAPSGSVNAYTANMAFSSSEPGSSFECRLTTTAWAPCNSPQTVDANIGANQFEVRATDPSGNTDPTPDDASYSVEPLAARSWAASPMLPSGTAGSDLDMATNGAGQATVVGVADGEVVATHRGSNGGFGAAYTVSAAGRFAPVTPKVAVDAQGNAIAVWAQFEGSNQRIWAAFKPGDGSFQTPQPISGAGVNAVRPEIAMSDDGDAIAVWTQGSSAASVRAAFRPAAGEFGEAETLSPTDEIAYQPRVAFDHLGNAIATWTQESSEDLVVRVASRPIGGAFGSARTLSPAGFDSDDAQIVFSRDNDALVSWTSQTKWHRMIEVAERPAGSDFGAAQRISNLDEWPGQAEVALDPDGDATAVWSDQGYDLGVRSASRPAGGAFGTPHTISYYGGTPKKVDPGKANNAVDPTIVLDDHGNATAAWSISQQGVSRVYTASKPAGAAMFTASAPVSSTDGQAYSPQLGLAVAGRPLVLFIQQDGSGAPFLQAAGQTD